MSYPWYEEVKNSEDLKQGDFISNCQVIIPPPQKITIGENMDIDIEELDTIILTQSCDLANNKVAHIMVCPIHNLEDFISSLPSDQTSSKKARNRIKDNLRKGYLPGYHLLNNPEPLCKNLEFSSDFIVVDFKNVYTINYQFAKTLVKSEKSRLRLLPPYREHLSQAFARYFMRVGLPQDLSIPEE